jgi:hypothetical protein
VPSLEALRAGAEGRIAECAVMQLRRLRMHIRPKIFACDEHPLRRNCLAKLQAPDKLDQRFQQAGLLRFAQIRQSGGRKRGNGGSWSREGFRRDLDDGGAGIRRIGLPADETLPLQRITEPVTVGWRTPRWPARTRTRRPAGRAGSSRRIASCAGLRPREATDRRASARIAEANRSSASIRRSRNAVVSIPTMR